MTRYPIVWLNVAVVPALAGAVVALFTVPPRLDAAVMALGGVLACGVPLIADHRGEGPPRPVGEFANAAAVGVMAAVGAMGVVVALGALPGAVVLAALAITSPPALHRLRNHLTPTASGGEHFSPARTATTVSNEVEWRHPPDHPPDTRTSPDLTAMTDTELCWVWRTSFTALQRTPGPDAADLVTNRAAYLDELERRHPTGFTRWLNSGARAAGDPTRFITPPTHPIRPRPT